MPASSVFEKLYKNLNPAQKEAVDTIEGPVMVIAGPGTGKTQILTLRIANILINTQINPDNILALTFTDSAVSAMRKRLSKIIGTPAYRVEITTFHTFCNEVIKHNPEDFPHLISSQSMTEIEQIQLLEKIINETNLELLKPFGDPLYYLKPSLSAINDLKKEGVSTDNFAAGIKSQEVDFSNIEDLLHEKGPYKGQMKGKYAEIRRNIQKQKELLQIYLKYQEALRVEKRYDFNDMLLEVVTGFIKNKDLLLRVQEVYQYVLVDEHQDTNTAQNKLIELICSFYENPNLFVVGDEKQAIYRFQGASLENFLYFKKLYPEAVLINLQHNYRSTQTILDAAGSVIKQNIASELLPERVDLKSSVNFAEEKIKVAELDDFYGEGYFLAEEIERKLKTGVKPKEIAVLCRNNKDLLRVVDVLEQKNIKFNIEADTNIFNDPQIKKLLLLLRAINNFGDDREIVAFLHSDYLKINQMDIYKLIKYSKVSKMNICDLISKQEVLEIAGIGQKEKLQKVFEMLAKWKTLSQNDNLESLFATVLNDSGLLDYIISQQNSLEIIDKLTALFEEIKLQVFRNPHFGLNEFLSYIDLLQEHELLIKRPVKTTQSDGVFLMTAHKSKGLEFEHVFIINVFDGHWGNMRKRSSGLSIPWEYFGVKLKLGLKIEENEDERRLFYVALTRAKKEVVMTYSLKSIEGKEQIPSQFIGEIDEKYKEVLDTTDFNKKFSLQKQIIFAPKNPPPQTKNQQFFKELFLERGLSISGLNNYLKCPWRYFYRNLLQLPDVKDRNLMFGTAVHQALNRYIRGLNNGGATNNMLISAYLDALASQPLSQKDFDELVIKGQKVLQKYYDQRMQYWQKGIQSEISIRGVRLSDEVVLNGVIDMIEKKDPVNVIVYDFKTGRPKSRSEIEGKNIGSDGNYLRQLQFYKLLIDLYYSGRLKMVEGVVDFIESDDKGKIKSEMFVVSEEEVKALRNQILFTAKEIVNLEFWDRRCDDPQCQYCQLRDLLN